MSIIQQAGLGLKALMLDRNAIKTIMERKSGWQVTFLIWIIVGIIMLSTYFLSAGAVSEDSMPLPLVIGLIILSPISLIINAGFIHLPAKLLGGKGSAMNMYKSIGSISLINFISWIPIINILVFIWILVVETIIVSEVHQLSIGKSIIAVLAVVFIILTMLFSIGSLAYIGSLNPLMYTR